MSNQSYVKEKIYLAVLSLCSDGSFEERLRSATISHFIQLEDDDLTGKTAEDLKFVLDWTKRNIIEGEIQRLPDDMERKLFIEKLVDLLLETWRS